MAARAAGVGTGSGSVGVIMGESVLLSGAASPLPARLRAHTLPFLAAVLGCSPREAWEQPLTFQVFDDVEARKDRRMAKTLHGPLSKLAQELERRNQAGAGIFLTVNETDGLGRQKGNITGLRAWWCDLDGDSVATGFRAESLPLPPSIVVRSGHGVHLYWCAAEAYPCQGDTDRQQAHEEELRRIQFALAALGADPKVCEVARVMRLPGFLNRKREPHERVEFMSISPVRYDPRAIGEAFPGPAQASQPRVGPSKVSPRRDDSLRRARAYLEVLAREAPAVSGAQGHSTTLQAAIKIACGFDLTEDEAFGLLAEVYNPMCRPPWGEADLRRKVREAQKVCSNRGWLNGGQGKGSLDSARGVREEPSAYLAPASQVEALHSPEPTRPSFPPFRLDAEGLWWLPKGKAEEDGSETPVKPQKLSGPFEIVAETRDGRAQGWGLRLRWLDRDGGVHEETIPRELALGEGAELARILIRGGLWVAPDEGKRKKLVAYLATVGVPARARAVDRVGWQGEAFVLPDESFGEAQAKERVYLALDLEHAFRVRGTLAEWQEEVGRHAVGNSRLTFAMACAYAAPLLGRLGMESGGFHLYGQSSKGKTTCVEAAGSVWGGPVYRETWRATSNGLEAVALSHCDCLLILDEQGQALPKEAGEVAYLLANGMDKARARKTLEARARRRWQTLFLSTGEITLADRMQAEGKAPKAGQDVRMVDIPVLPVGLDQTFERWQGFESSKALADHLRLATRRSYGTAARAFLQNLCKATDAELLALEARKAEWARRHNPRGADSQVGRVIDRFALVALAGELAAEWGIAPWPTGNASWAVSTCLTAWIVHRGGVGSGEFERGIAAVLGFLERHGAARFSDWEHAGERIVNRAGFRRRDGQDRIDYLFHAEGWKDACEGFNPRDVARACAERGLLEVVQESGRSRYQKNVKVPGQGTERFYIITGRGLDAFRAQQEEAECSLEAS